MTQCIVVAVAGRAKAWQLRLSRSRGDQLIYSSPIESSCCCLLHFSSRSPWVASHVSAAGRFQKIFPFSFRFLSILISIATLMRWDDSLDEGHALRSFFVFEAFEINQKTTRKDAKMFVVLHSEKLKVIWKTDNLLLDYFAECRQRWFMEQRDRKWALHKYRNKRTLKIRW